MQQGDFTECARYYVNRAGYSDEILDRLLRHVSTNGHQPKIAEIGAGTGILTKQLLERQLQVVAVEPNDAMRREGIEHTRGGAVTWKNGTGEETGLETNAFDWVLMASSFHWTDTKKSLPEFARILKRDGFFTALWNPRDLARSDLHGRIEKRIYDIAPSIERKSSGASKYTEGLEKNLTSSGHFKNPFFLEERHEVVMSRARYMAVWRSVNDIQAQVGPRLWDNILSAIEEEIRDLNTIVVPYKTRSWTVQKRQNS